MRLEADIPEFFEFFRTVKLCSSGSSREQTVDTGEFGVDGSRMMCR